MAARILAHLAFVATEIFARTAADSFFLVRTAWPSAFEIARTLVEQVPDDSIGWIHQAYALRRMPGGGINQAWDALLPAADKFPKEALISYNLSCYA